MCSILLPSQICFTCPSIIYLSICLSICPSVQPSTHLSSSNLQGQVQIWNSDIPEQKYWSPTHTYSLHTQLHHTQWGPPELPTTPTTNSSLLVTPWALGYTRGQCSLSPGKQAHGRGLCREFGQELLGSWLPRLCSRETGSG